MLGFKVRQKAIAMMGTIRYYSILGLCRDSGKENGNYHSMLGLCKDNGKENGNYNSILGLYGDNGKVNGNYYSSYSSPQS